MIKDDDDNNIDGNAGADEFLLGGYHSGAAGRSLAKQQATLIVAEELPDGRTGKIGLRHIENFKANTLQCAIEEITTGEAQLTTDSLSSYKSLEGEVGRKIIKGANSLAR